MQYTAASRTYLNSDAASGFDLSMMKNGEFYYDDGTGAAPGDPILPVLWIMVDTGGGVLGLLQLSPPPPP